MLIGVDASRALVAQRTGTENYALHLLRGLLQAGEEHLFRFYVPHPPPDGLFPRRDNLEFCVLRVPRLWTHLGLSWELSRRRPDVLFVPAHVLPLLCPCPSVVTVHDLGYLFYPQAHSRFARCYLDLTTRRHARTASRIIAVSTATQNDLVKCYRADAGRIRVIHSGFDASLQPSEKHATPTVARTRYGIRGDYFLFLGSVQPRKNLSRLVEAFAQVQTERSACYLLIGGKPGRYQPALQQQISNLGLESRVVLAGYIPEIHKRALLSGAQAFVFPSLYEGFGLPVLEAQACDTPVICANGSSLPEVAGDAALYVAPHDVGALAQAMIQLLDDDALRANLIARGRKNLTRFSWQRCAQETLDVLTSVG